MMLMIGETDARARILEAVNPLPKFDNSAMDGYAVIARDCRKGARF
jgi:molybdopterin biosynthesis enzyme